MGKINISSKRLYNYKEAYFYMKGPNNELCFSFNIPKYRLTNNIEIKLLYGNLKPSLRFCSRLYKLNNY